MILQLRRWLPQRPPGAGGRRRLRRPRPAPTAANRWRNPLRSIARLRLDAALYEPAPPRQPGPERSAPAERPTAARAEITRRPSRSVLYHRRGSLVQRRLPARWNSPRKRRSGIARASRPCPCAGSWFGTPRANSPHRLCCALTWPWNRHRFWNGFVLRWQLEVTFQEVPSASGRGDPTPVVGSRHRPAPRQS